MVQRYSQLKQAQTLLPAGVQEVHGAALLQRHHVEELEGPAMLQALAQVRLSDTAGCQGSAIQGGASCLGLPVARHAAGDACMQLGCPLISSKGSDS